MAVAVMAVLAVGCGDGGGKKPGGPTATVGGSSTSVGATEDTSTTGAGAEATTTTTFEGDPYAIPEVIDEAYVNRVLAGLDQAVGDIVREVVAAKSLPKPVMERLVALYEGEFLQRNLDLFQEDSRMGFSGYRSPPGNQQTLVLDLITATRSCIFAEVRRDYSAVALEPPSTPSQIWVALKPLREGRGPAGVNSTNWIYVYDGFQPGRIKPMDPCVEL